jgi:ectoine hydroxylase-related dioxygenase (phytanoyl-CoA dioxygenase family)
MFFQQNQTSEIKRFFNENGFAVIKNVFPKIKIDSIKNIISKNLNKNNKDFLYEVINNKKTLRRIEKITDHFYSVKNLIRSQEVKKLFMKLNKNQILFKDKLNFKFPNGDGFLPHLDGHFYWSKNENHKFKKGWKVYSKNFTNIAIHLEDSSKKNGCLYIASKNDTKKLGNTWELITNKLSLNTPNIKKKDLKNFKFFPLEVSTGDIIIFDWKCCHYSKKNNSNKSRMILYLTYCDKEKKNVRQTYYADRKLSKTNINFKSCIYK